MRLNVNGADVEVDDRFAASPLLWVLRDVLGMHGTKYGCGIGYCAACTVLIDGRNTKSCQTPAGQAVGKAVTTVEGASGPVVDAVRDAWHRRNVVQCGYCQGGQTLAATALLEADRSPDDAAVAQWMNGNLCRCGTYPRIRDAIREAAGTLAAGRKPEPLAADAELEMQPLTPEELADPVHPYVRIGPDGTVVAYSNQIEMGQGVHTGLATIVAEELDADFASVRVVNAANGATPGGDVYGTPAGGGFIQLTGASTSTVGFWARYRLAAAQARARLAAAAAQAWGVPAEEVEISSGVVSHRSGKSAGFGDLAVRAAQLPVPDGVQPKDPGQYKLIGREGRLRVDAPGKILGKTRFTIDVTLPRMLTAVVLHPPKFGATAAAVDDSAALAEPGVTAVVPIEEGVAVVGETFDDAQRGVRALRVDWDEQHAERRSSEELLAEHRRLVESGEQAVVAREDGDVAAALAGAAHVVDAIYELPYLAHAPMEPNNAVCRMGDDGILEVWAGTEGPVYDQMAASAAAGIDRDRVRVHVPFAGGSFGLHSTSGHDPTSEAVQVARALDWKYPVKLQSLREEEFKSGRYRAMAVHRVRAGADAQGRLTAFHQQIAAEPTSPNLPFAVDFLFKDGVDYMTTTAPSTARTRWRTSSWRPPTSRPACPSWYGARSGTPTPNSPASQRSTNSPSPPGATPWTCAANCWPTTRAPCARWNWRPTGPGGDPRCPRAAPAASPAAASSATAPRSPRSPSTTATASTSRGSPSRSTAASPSTPTWSAPRSKAGSSTRSAPPPGARSSSATAARSSPRTSTATRSCGCIQCRRSTCS